MRALIKYLLKLICRLKGCDYQTALFRSSALHFCERCGEEITRRGLHDLEPPLDPKEWQAWHDDYYSLTYEEPRKVNRLYLAIKYWCQLNYSWRLAWIKAQR